LIWKFSQAG